MHVRIIAPELRVWFSTEKMAGIPLLTAIEAVGGQGWFPDAATVTPELLSVAHTLGLKVGVWTVNERDALKAAVADGVDAICTDYPDRLALLLGRMH